MSEKEPSSPADVIALYSAVVGLVSSLILWLCVDWTTKSFFTVAKDGYRASLNQIGYLKMYLTFGLFAVSTPMLMGIRHSQSPTRVQVVLVLVASTGILLVSQFNDLGTTAKMGALVVMYGALILGVSLSRLPTRHRIIIELSSSIIIIVLALVISTPHTSAATYVGKTDLISQYGQHVVLLAYFTTIYVMIRKRYLSGSL